MSVGAQVQSLVPIIFEFTEQVESIYIGSISADEEQDFAHFVLLRVITTTTWRDTNMHIAIPQIPTPLSLPQSQKWNPNSLVLH